VASHLTKVYCSENIINTTNLIGVI
jgi:hypothetical protein